VYYYGDKGFEKDIQKSVKYYIKACDLDAKKVKRAI
jgi:TPR repeat protein